jgi:hypothetical protein
MPSGQGFYLFCQRCAFVETVSSFFQQFVSADRTVEQVEGLILDGVRGGILNKNHLNHC